MGTLDSLVAMLAASATLGATIRAFGGEDPLKASPAPDNWHHEGLTRKAAQAVPEIPDPRLHCLHVTPRRFSGRMFVSPLHQS